MRKSPERWVRAPSRFTLNINGRAHKLEVEPRVTLLDALRNRLNLTGSKRVCDRGSCGACTVIVDGRTLYACSTLAIEMQGKTIRTVESFTTGTVLHPVQQAFCDKDGLMCGFCTPGFVTSAVALLEKNPKPTAAKGAGSARRQHLPVRHLCARTRSGAWHDRRLARTTPSLGRTTKRR